MEGGLRKWISSIYESFVRGTWRRKGRLWRRAPLSMGSSLGNLEGGSSTRDFERWLKGALELQRLCLREFCEGNLEGGLPCWGRKVGKALEKGISFHRGPVGEPVRGSSTGDFEGWMMGTLRMERLSLKRLSG